MMKIFIAIDHLKEGGAERVASILINSLCKSHEIFVVVVDKQINYPLTDSCNIRCITSGKNYILRKISRFLNYRKLIAKEKPNVIISLGNFMSIYTIFSCIGIKNIKVISSERTDPTKEPTGRLSRVLRNFAYKNSDVLVCQTHWVAEYFAKNIKTNFAVIPNPITPHLPIWSGQKSHVVMTACRLVPQKNLSMLLKAFAKLNNYYPESLLEIYGDGEERSNLEKLAVKLNIENQVMFCGFNSNIHEKMKNSLMYVSSSNYEGISNSMLEALAIGVPTICTDCPVGGARQFIQSGQNGMLVKVGDVNGLFMAMKRLYEEKNIASEFSKNSQRIREKLNPDVIAKKWINLVG